MLRLKNILLLFTLFIFWGCSTTSVNTKIHKVNSDLQRIEVSYKGHEQLEKKDKFLIENGKAELVKLLREGRMNLNQANLNLLKVVEYDIQSIESSELNTKQKSEIKSMKHRIKTLKSKHGKSKH